MRLDSAALATEKKVVTTSKPTTPGLGAQPLSSSQALLRNIGVVAVVSLLVFGFNDYLTGLMPTFYFFYANVVFTLPIVFFLIYRRHEEIAKALLLLILNACVFVAELSAPLDDGVRFFFIPVALLTLMFYETNERAKVAYGLSLPLVAFSLSFIPELRIAPPITDTTLTPELSKIVNFVGVYVVTMAEIMVFIRYIRALRIEAALHSKFSALGILSSGIAHEINNPLAIIKGRSEILAHKISVGADTASLQAEAAAITRTVDRIARIIRGLRLFTRDSSDDPFQAVPATIIVETAMDLCHEKIQQAGIKVDVVLHHPLVVQGLETQLIQVLVNLLNNARDAIEGRENPWIRIDVKEDRICVTDCGTGIPHQIVDQIMLPFFTTKGPEKGSGLGLSICKGILEHHGGELFLDRRSRNTCFVMKFRQLVMPTA
ncbi:MAG: hypothetical protein KF767_05610 [Bdellovibrionaceae bacterium]|nr:hypothetical protein [Pseudobdellovibrionaceae bacterium]